MSGSSLLFHYLIWSDLVLLCAHVIEPPVTSLSHPGCPSVPLSLLSDPSCFSCFRSLRWISCQIGHEGRDWAVLGGCGFLVFAYTAVLADTSSPRGLPGHSVIITTDSCLCAVNWDHLDDVRRCVYPGVKRTIWLDQNRIFGWCTSVRMTLHWPK